MMMQNKICCFGEFLFRMSPSVESFNDHSMPFFIGGAELNVAHALAQWEIPVKYLSALPKSSLAEFAIQSMNMKGIDTSAVFFHGDRIGIYYLPVGSELKNAGVIYDRAGSSFSELQTGMLDWENILKDCSWFHFSAISPALNKNVADVCLEALIAAKKMGLTVSVDLNYRSKLWQYGVEPPRIMNELVQYCDVIMGNIWSAESLLGISAGIENSNGKTNEELLSTAMLSIKKINESYLGASTVAFTFRLNDQYWSVLDHDGQQYVSRKYAIDKVIDKVGTGDCFMAGIIYGCSSGLDPQQLLEFATAAAVGKHAEAGDHTSQSKNDVYSKILP